MGLICSWVKQERTGETRTHLGGDLASTNGGGGRGDEVEEKGEMDGGEEEEALLSPC